MADISLSGSSMRYAVMLDASKCQMISIQKFVYVSYMSSIMSTVTAGRFRYLPEIPHAMPSFPHGTPSHPTSLFPRLHLGLGHLPPLPLPRHFILHLLPTNRDHRVARFRGGGDDAEVFVGRGEEVGTCVAE